MSSFDEFVELVLELEGKDKLSLDPKDKGNYRNGLLIGTKYGISAAAHPNVDIPNLTKAQAIAIYRAKYWDVLALDNYNKSFALCLFDASVNEGVGAAKGYLMACPSHDYVELMGLRFQSYTTYSTWNTHGKGWIRRLAKILEEARKLSQPLPNEQPKKSAFDAGSDFIESLLRNTRGNDE